LTGKSLYKNCQATLQKGYGNLVARLGRWWVGSDPAVRCRNCDHTRLAHPRDGACLAASAFATWAGELEVSACRCPRFGP
jgi:hypothetical protein